jgi:hypothetical protein
MPTRVQLPDGNIGEFPDGMPESEIEKVLQKQYGAPSAPENEPIAGDPSGRTSTGAPAVGDKRNFLQRSLDNMTTPDPRKEEWQSSGKTGLDRFAQGIGSTFLPLISHPIDSAIGMAKSLGHATVDSNGTAGGFGASLLQPMVKGAVEDYQQNGPAKALPHIAGQLVGGAATGELQGAALGQIPKVGSAIRTAAIGNADAAGLKALRVGGASKQGLSTLDSIEGSRPYLKGASSLEDLQGRIPGAKAEIWGPYQDTVDSIAGKKVQGPDGPTTVGDLEKQRLEISANLRTLKANGPEAVALAQQKGLTQADLISQEKAVQSALDPHLEAAGIDPKLIRQTFGQVARVGGKVAGRTTIPEKPQPYGFGKMLDSNPFTSAPGETLGNLGGGLRDLVAGRPWWSGKPTDVAVKDAFRLGGEKPDFRAPVSSMPAFQAKPLQLPSSTIGNADISTDPLELNGGFERSSSSRTGQPPPSRLALPAIAGDGELKPMVGVLKHPGAQRTFDPEITRISPSNPDKPSLQPGGGYTVGPDGTVRNIPRMLMGEIGTPDVPKETFYTGDMETPMYPNASTFRAKPPRSWTADELKVLNKKEK